MIVTEEIKKMLYLSIYDPGKNKEKIEESVEVILESARTKGEAYSILKRNGYVGDIANDIMSKLEQDDPTPSKNFLQLMAVAYVGTKSRHKVIEILNDVKTLIDDQEIDMPIINVREGNIRVNNKVFDDFKDFLKYIDKLGRASSSYSDWKNDPDRYDVEDSTPIWEGNNIKIYDGNDIGKCIKYGSGSLTGKQYSFCIGSAGNTNWQSYRDNKSSTFYYVLDGNFELDNPSHMMVVDHTQNGWEVVDERNTPGSLKSFASDENYVYGYLRDKMGVPVDKILRNKPITDDEMSSTEKLNRPNKDLSWFLELGFENQSRYIGRGNQLSDEQFIYIWDLLKSSKNQSRESAYKLLNQYLNTGVALPPKQFELLTSED